MSKLLFPYNKSIVTKGYQALNTTIKVVQKTFVLVICEQQNEMYLIAR